jgi:hypothetical protein
MGTHALLKPRHVAGKVTPRSATGSPIGELGGQASLVSVGSQNILEVVGIGGLRRTCRTKRKRNQRRRTPSGCSRVSHDIPPNSFTSAARLLSEILFTITLPRGVIQVLVALRNRIRSAHAVGADHNSERTCSARAGPVTYWVLPNNSGIWVEPQDRAYPWARYVGQDQADLYNELLPVARGPLLPPI